MDLANVSFSDSCSDVNEKPKTKFEFIFYVDSITSSWIVEMIVLNTVRKV